MIYVDRPLEYPAAVCPRKGRLGTVWAHLVCDGDEEELHVFAEKLGLTRQYFQKDARLAHYDVTARLAEKAVTLGAKSISRKELCKLILGLSSGKKKG